MTKMGKMKTTRLFFLIGVAFATLGSQTVIAQQKTQPTITLYSPLKHQGDQSRSYFDFQNQTVAPRGGRWDVGYGAMYITGQFDWFQGSSAPDNRSVIRDLGKHAWSDNPKVPLIKPLAKLQPGQRRQIRLELSGARRTDGAPGVPGDASDPGIDDRRRDLTSGRQSSRPLRDFGEVVGPSPYTTSLRRDAGKPKIDPLFVKAIAGHMYVIHVVDDSRDFYALFRVEALQRGDSCTVSWRLIP
jgi:hypothetical protein